MADDWFFATATDFLLFARWRNKRMQPTNVY